MRNRWAKEKVPENLRASLESLIQEGRAAVEKQDDGLIRSLSERLEREAHGMASAMHQEGDHASSSAGETGPRPGEKDTVVDAEFEDA